MSTHDARKWGWIYFAQVVPDGVIRIGFTSNHPSRRLQVLRDTSPHEINIIGLCRTTKEHERAAQLALAEHQFRNSWFHPHPDVLAYIEHVSFPRDLVAKETAPVLSKLKNGGFRRAPPRRSLLEMRSAIFRPEDNQGDAA